MIDDSIKCLFVLKLLRTNKAKKNPKTSKSMMNVHENCNNIIVILRNYNIIKMYVWVDTLHNCIQLFLFLFIKKKKSLYFRPTPRASVCRRGGILSMHYCLIISTYFLMYCDL